MAVPQSPFRGWRLAILLVLSLYGLAQNSARNAFYTQKVPLETHLNVTDDELSNVLGGGYAVYAIGKLIYGAASDHVGGKYIFVYCFSMTGIVTAGFAMAHSLRGVAAAWLLSRAFQPSGFMGVIKLVGVWFHHSQLGTCMAIISMTTYAGDAASRLLISAMVTGGLDWQGVFIASGAITFSVAVLAIFVLKPSPVSVGLEPTPINPHSAFAKSDQAALAANTDNDDNNDANVVDGGGGGGNGTTAAATKAKLAESEGVRRPLKDVLRALGKSTFFWLICIQVLLLGTMREIFVTYLSTFLNQWAGASESASILFSSLFPLMGIPGCLSAGMLVDKYQRKRNGAIMVSFTGILTVLCFALYMEVKADPAHANHTNQSNHSQNFTHDDAYTWPCDLDQQFGPTVITANDANNILCGGGEDGAATAISANQYYEGGGDAAAPSWVEVYQTEVKRSARVGPATVLSAAIGIFLIGPYSLLCGVFSADVGGKGSSGTASGIVDFCGYFGSIIFFMIKGQLPGSSYEVIFLIVLLLAGSSLLCSIGFLVLDWKKAKEYRRYAVAHEDGNIQESLLLNDTRDPLLD